MRSLIALGLLLAPLAARAAGRCPAGYDICVSAAKRFIEEYKDPDNPDPKKSKNQYQGMIEELQWYISRKEDIIAFDLEHPHHGGGGGRGVSASVSAVRKEIASLNATISDLSGKMRAAQAEVAARPAAKPKPDPAATKPPTKPALMATAAVQEGSLASKPAPTAEDVVRVTKTYGEAGSPRDAARVLEENIGRIPPSDANDKTFGSAFGAAGKGLLEAGDAAGARASLDKAVELSPKDAALKTLRAKSLLMGGDKEAAAAEARKALALDPGDETARLIAGYGDLSSGAGKALSKPLSFGGSGEAGAAPGPGAPAPAAPGRPGAEASVPSNLPRPSQTRAPPAPMPPGVAELLRSAEAKLERKDYESALVDLSQALEADPGNAKARIMRAEILNAMGEHEAALKDAEEALKSSPDDPRALRAQAYALLQLGRHREAYEAAKRATSLEPGSGLGWLYLAMAEEKLGMREEAIEHYRKAMALDRALAPAAREGLRRLGASGSAGAPRPGPWLIRGGFAALALLLIAAGLFGTESGRRAVGTAGRWLTGRGRAPAAEAAPSVEPGTTLGGHFRVVREIGSGGMGVVYEAEDLALQRKVAVKQLKRDAHSTEEDYARFLAEARLAAKLRHQGLAEILTVIEDGDIFLVFEFLEGETLDALLARRGRFSPPEARGLLAEICAALDFAHGRKIIHRDLKPSNVMVTTEGACKVMDLGIAHQSSSNATTKTMAAGTPPYMAPEQMMGSVSRAADVYALGVMAYELLTGARPFAGPNFLDQKLDADFVPATKTLPSLPKGLDAFFKRVLASDPRARPQSGAEFLKELDAALRA